MELSEYHPEPPPPLNLEQESFVVCPNEDPAVYVCMDHKNVQTVVRNKTKILRWSKEMRATLDFYTGVPEPISDSNNISKDN